MKLGKLLAAGKSIMNGRTDVSYRSSKQIYLPKFGASSNNPFKSEAPSQAVETAPGAEKTRPASGAATAPANTSVAAPEPRVSASGSAIATEKFCVRTCPPVSVARPINIPPAPAGGEANLPATPAASRQGKDGSTFQRFNAFLCSALGKTRGSDEKDQKGTATQTELSLDSVKVVHNDLSDVDVEVVPIKSRSGAPELPAPKKSWEYVGERLFGVEAT